LLLSVAFFGRHLTSFTVDKTVDPAVYDDYVGRYDYGSEGAMAVTREGGQLFTKLTGNAGLRSFRMPRTSSSGKRSMRRSPSSGTTKAR